MDALWGCEDDGRVRAAVATPLAPESAIDGYLALRELGVRRATDLVGGYQAWAATVSRETR